jgi:hypothetical protein
MGLIQFIKKGITLKRILNVLGYYYRKVLYKLLFALLKNENLIFQFVRIKISWLTNYEAYKLVDLKIYLENNKDVSQIFSQEIELSYSKPKFLDDLENDSNLQTETTTNQRVIQIKNGLIKGDSNLVILNNKEAFYQLSNFNHKLNIDFKSDSSIIYYESNFIITKSPYSTKKIDHAIWLGGNFSWNYYHLLYEFLVKFQHIDKIPQTIPILIDDICLKIPQYVELIKKLNHDNRSIITIYKNEHVKIDNLYLITCPNIIPSDIINISLLKANDVLINKDSILKLRLDLLKFKSNKTFPKKIYISRKKASGRRQFNEDEVFDCLKKYDFESIAPETYSLTDQITLFNSAEIIVGGSGAAFTNLLFCNNKCKAVIFYKNKLDFSGFSTIAAAMGVELIYVLQEYAYNSSQKDIHDSFTIDTNELDKHIVKWLN